MNHIRKEDAVSPVIGVMLMLVIVLIIAAVISVFASGLVSDTSTAPSAVIEVGEYAFGDPSGQDYMTSITFKHVSGDSLNIDNLILEGEYNFAIAVHKLKDNDEWTLHDLNEDGLWGAGELLVYTDDLSDYEVMGLFNYAFSNAVAEVRFSTIDGHQIWSKEVYFRGNDDSGGGWV